MEQQADIEVELVTAKWTVGRNFLFITQRDQNAAGPSAFIFIALFPVDALPPAAPPA
jgi:hypothetical protein